MVTHCSLKILSDACLHNGSLYDTEGSEPVAGSLHLEGVELHRLRGCSNLTAWGLSEPHGLRIEYVKKSLLSYYEGFAACLSKAGHHESGEANNKSSYAV